jgi:hypothetical protein
MPPVEVVSDSSVFGVMASLPPQAAANAQTSPAIKLRSTRCFITVAL